MSDERSVYDREEFRRSQSIDAVGTSQSVFTFSPVHFASFLQEKEGEGRLRRHRNMFPLWAKLHYAGAKHERIFIHSHVRTGLFELFTPRTIFQAIILRSLCAFITYRVPYKHTSVKRSQL